MTGVSASSGPVAHCAHCDHPLHPGDPVLHDCTPPTPAGGHDTDDTWSSSGREVGAAPPAGSSPGPSAPGVSELAEAITWKQADEVARAMAGYDEWPEGTSLERIIAARKRVVDVATALAASGVMVPVAEVEALRSAARDVIVDFGYWCDHHDTCVCSLSRLARLAGEGR